MRKWYAAAAAALVLGAASAASAAVETIDFTLDFTTGGTEMPGLVLPYDLPWDALISGSLSADTTLSGVAAFQALNLTTGSKTWTLSDLTSDSHINLNGDGHIDGFLLYFGPGPWATSSLNGGLAVTASWVNDHGAVITDGSSVDEAGVTFTNVDAPGVTNVPPSDPGLPGGVPEPGTWALMLLGVGGMGAVLRHRRQLAGGCAATQLGSSGA